MGVSFSKAVAASMLIVKDTFIEKEKMARGKVNPRVQLVGN